MLKLIPQKSKLADLLADLLLNNRVFYAWFRWRYSYPSKREVRAIYAAYVRERYARSVVITSEVLFDYRTMDTSNDLAQIGARHGKTAERVRQILLRFYHEARNSKLQY